MQGCQSPLIEIFLSYFMNVPLTFSLKYFQALVNIAYEMNADKMSVLSSSRTTIETFLSEATALGIRVPHVLEYRPHEADLPTKVIFFWVF